jgi:hypothetical protein
MSPLDLSSRSAAERSASSPGPPTFVPFLLFIPLAALIAVMPLIHHGCSCGHDFDFHLLNWMEAARQFSHGNLHPQWAFTPAFNAGEPRFVFYPPISWTLGALLGLILTHLPGVTETAAWNATPILFTWIALTLSGLTMHRFARAFVGANTALLASLVYLANPYMLFTAYERTAYAELLAAAWIPLLFLAILRSRVTPSRIAIPLALLWLTNVPAAIMGSYTLAALAAIRIATGMRAPFIASSAINGFTGGPKPNNTRLASGTWVARHRASLRIALNTISGTVVGLALAAFYIIPAVYEHRFVQFTMATIGGMNIARNFFFEHTGTSPDSLLHDQVLHTASVIAIILLATTAITLVITALFTQENPSAPSEAAVIDNKARVILSAAKNPRISSLPFPALPFTILTAAIAFLLTPPSLFLWTHLPEASLLQFTWRLLAILAPIASLSLAAAIGRIRINALQTAALYLLVAIAFSHVAYHAFVQPCDPEDTPTARLALFHSNAGTDPTDEYTPTTADNDALTPGAPPYWLAAAPDDPPPSATQPGPSPMHIDLPTHPGEYLILNLRNYPAWRIRIDGSFNAARMPRHDGLIALPMIPIVSTVDISYASSFDHTVGDDLTLFTLGLMLLNLYRKRRAIES